MEGKEEGNFGFGISNFGMSIWKSDTNLHKFFTNYNH